jgi:hypothetical protein
LLWSWKKPDLGSQGTGKNHQQSAELRYNWENTTLHWFDDSLPLVHVAAGGIVYSEVMPTHWLATVFACFPREAASLASRRAKWCKSLCLIAIACVWNVAPVIIAVNSQAQTQPAASPASAVKPIGTIKAISGNTVTLTTDSGSTLSIVIQDSTRMVRTLPGKKDLQGATPAQLHDLLVGDRIIVARGTPSDDGKSVTAAVVYIMAGTDIAARQQQEREDWRKRGIGGTVKSTDPANGTVTVTVSSFRGNKDILVHVSKSTIIRRWPAGSANYDDAKPGTLDQIQPDDQLRARGNKNADGSELDAEEIVSGKFRNVAGPVVSTDAANNSVIVQDVFSKSQVTLKLTSDSQLRNLPPMLAQRIAQRFKASSQGGANGAAPAQNAEPTPTGGTPTGAGTGARAGGSDFQQLLDRMPAVTLADLQKGTVVMAVATEGSASVQPTAITLLTGVDAILTAAPDSKGAAMLLSPWNIGGGDAAAGGANP